MQRHEFDIQFYRQAECQMNLGATLDQATQRKNHFLDDAGDGIRSRLDYAEDELYAEDMRGEYDKEIALARRDAVANSIGRYEAIQSMIDDAFEEINEVEGLDFDD